MHRDSLKAVRYPLFRRQLALVSIIGDETEPDKYLVSQSLVLIEEFQSLVLIEELRYVELIWCVAWIGCRDISFVTGRLENQRFILV